MKQNVTKYEDLDLDYRTLGQAIAAIQGPIDKIGEEAQLEVGEYGISVTYCREETDEEYKNRLQGEETMRLHRKRQYEQLKKEFEA